MPRASHLRLSRCYSSCNVGFHEFAEFVAADVGTVDSGLNSMVLANNSEMVLLPINEPTFGTKRKSQIQVGLAPQQGKPSQMAPRTTFIVIAQLAVSVPQLQLGAHETICARLAAARSASSLIPQLQLLGVCCPQSCPPDACSHWCMLHLDTHE